MATNTVQNESSPATPTVIEVLQARYDAANEAYDQRDAATLAKGTPEVNLRNLILKDGQACAYKEAQDIQHTLMQQQPVTWKDALILMAHTYSIGSDIEQTTEAYRAREFEVLERALETLLVFIEGETDAELGGYMRSSINFARRNVMMRQGRIEAFDAAFADRMAA